ncbi:MAG: Gx transporter family protein [Actinobacteria bacterium]|nr:Gx transporter family protein [Actinomycetota bacterium]
MLSTDKKKPTFIVNFTLIAFVAALSVAISFFEDFFLPVIPLPGVSFGLNNAVFLVFLGRLSMTEICLAELLKIVTSAAVYKGFNPISLFLSTAGTAAVLIVFVFYKKILSNQGFTLVTASVISSSLHLLAQIAVSSIILKNIGPFAYLPFSGIVSVFLGFIVGIIANYTHSKIR